MPRHNPTSAKINNGESLTETAAKGVEAIHAIVTERDQLLISNDRYHTEAVLKDERIRQLEARLGTTTHERDHYMRYCTEITTRLNNIHMLIVSTIEESKHSAAFKPTVVTRVPDNELSVDNQDASKLESILSRLSMNSGDTTELPPPKPPTAKIPLPNPLQRTIDKI